MKPGELELWADGSCPVPYGPGGWGYVLRFCDSQGVIHEREGNGGAESTTNNRMELQAVIEGLRAIRGERNLTVYCDSEYVVKAFTHGWLEKWVSKGWHKSTGGMVLNQDLWKLLLELESRHNVTWKWVKGHANIELNERCDVLAAEGRPIVLTTEEELERDFEHALYGDRTDGV